MKKLILPLLLALALLAGLLLALLPRLLPGAGGEVRPAGEDAVLSDEQELLALFARQKQAEAEDFSAACEPSFYQRLTEAEAKHESPDAEPAAEELN